MIPKVMIILGSASDKEIAIKSIKILEKLQIPHIEPMIRLKDSLWMQLT